MKNLTSKESVGRIVLTASVGLTIACSAFLYDSYSMLEESNRQLDKARIQIKAQQTNYKELEAKFLNVESESQKLSQKQEELQSTISNLEAEKSNLETENGNLKGEVEQLKKMKADAKAKAERERIQQEQKQKKQPKPQQTQQSQEQKPQSSNVVSAGYENWQKVTVEATGYSNVADELGGGDITAKGTGVRWGIIAVDPRVIPLGSKVYIPAFGQTFVAEDTGGAIKGNRIDIFFDHGDKARSWGRRSIEIYVQK
ncbi:3D domain-containing protein [Bacillus gaemokensis]|uniref:3D domain-containing protein n=1 Tax=Bacillus gaemokensis TaxID=574375 RepID=UPI000690D466|nr:3D domain-containing protein [Bacillus gaemokensis]KYG38118.1 hypothetical protein AZF08_20430 [Bacillus gaemokensis]